MIDEAQKYRKRAQQAEAERDQLAAHLETLQRTMIEQQLDGTVTPEALWASGATIPDLLTDGIPDTTKIAVAVTTAREAFGIPRLPAAPSAEGQGQVGVPINSGDRAPTWARAIQEGGSNDH